MKNKNNLIFVISGVVFITGLVVCMGLTSVISKMIATLTANADIVALMETHKQSLNNLTNQAESTAAAGTALNNFIFSKEALHQLENTLKELGAQSGVKVRVFDSKENTNLSDTSFSTLTTTVTLEGNLAAIQYMYQLIEALPYHSWVSQLSLKQVDLNTDTDEWKSELIFNLTLNSL